MAPEVVETRGAVYTIKTKANTPVLALGRNPRRIVWSLLNASDTPIYFGYDSSVSTSGRSMGWKVDAGGAIEDEFHKGEVWIICSQDDKQVTLVEVSRVEGG